MAKAQIPESQIEREWRMFGSVIPASQIAGPPGELGIIPGRARTRYFYRKTAIAFAQDARRPEWIPGSRHTFRNLALYYFKLYRERSGNDQQLPPVSNIEREAKQLGAGS